MALGFNPWGALPNKENLLTGLVLGPVGMQGRQLADTFLPGQVPNLFTDQPREPFTPAPLAPDMPAYQAYKGAYDNGDSTKLDPNLRLSDKANWGSLIQGPDAFQGSGLAAQEAGTVRDPQTGMTPWEALLTQRQQGEQSQIGTDTSAQAQSQAAQAKGGLASKGGLRAGSAERIDQNLNRQNMFNQQNVSREGALGRLGIGAEAEQNRLSTLSDVSQSQQNIWDTTSRLDQAAQEANARNLMASKTFDIDNLLAERQREAQSAQEGYNQDINKWIGQVYAGALGRR